MKKRTHKFGVLLCLCTVLLAASGCAPAPFPGLTPTAPTLESLDSSRPPLPDMGPLVIGYLPVMGYAPLFVAVEKGYLQEQGLEYELQSFRSGSFMIAPMSTGLIDVGAGETGTALFNAIDQEFDLRVVAALGSQPEGYGAVPLLVRRDLLDSEGVTGPADLKGRRVAVNVERGMAEYLLAEALASVSLTVDDVELIALPFPEMPAALENGALDAAILPYPLASKALGSGAAAILIEGDAIADTPQNGVIYFGQRLLDPENREAGIRYLVAHMKAARDLQGDGWRSEEHVAILHKYTGLPDKSILGAVPYYMDPNGEINRSSTESIQQYLFDRGYTGLSQPLPLSQVIGDSFLAEALERLGRSEP